MKFKQYYWSFINSQFIYHINFLWHWKNFFFLLRYPFYRVHNRWTGKFSGWDISEYESIPYGWRKAFGKQLTKELDKAVKEEIKRLKEEGHKHVTYKKVICWEQIKEKYGTLRLYCACTEKIQKILDKYELMSEGYCICCGKPVRYRTRGWIEYYCEDCMTKDLSSKNQEGEYLYKDEYRLGGYKEERLTKEDLPQITHYEYKVIKTETLNSEEEFDKRWDELWDSPHRPQDEVYHRVNNEDGTWTIEYQQRIEHIVDIKQEYGIDFEELWGLK